MKSLLLGLLAGMLWGQQSITLTAPAPSSSTAISARIVGNQGNSTYYYWVIATFPIGNGIGPNYAQINRAPDTFSASNYVAISWSPISGVATYDLLRTTTPNLPSSCVCAVSTGMTGNTFNDQGSGLTAYSYVSASSASGSISLNNSTLPFPSMVRSPTVGGMMGWNNIINPPIPNNWTAFGANCTTGTGNGITGGVALSVKAVIHTGHSICGLNTPVTGNFTHTFVIYYLQGSDNLFNSNPGVGVGFYDGTKAEWCAYTINNSFACTTAATLTTPVVAPGATVCANLGASQCVAPGGATAMVFRLSKNGSTLTCDFSPDGVNWINLLTDSAPFLTPTSVFYGVDSNGGGNPFFTQAFLHSYN